MFKCPNDCVGKLIATLEGYTIKNSSGSNVEYAQIDVITKLQAWKEVARRKSRGLWHCRLGC